jgi:RNA polymerase sigma factor (sigma-70 family)
MEHSLLHRNEPAGAGSATGSRPSTGALGPTLIAAKAALAELGPPRTTLAAGVSRAADPEPAVLDGDGLAMCSTLDLLERAQGGNEAAWEVVFRRCVRGLRRFAVGRLPAQCRGMNDTEDLVQETVIRALHRLDRFEFRHEGALLAYLRQSLLNRIVDEVRKTSRRPSPVTLTDDQIDRGASPLESAIGRENIERYEAALSRLRQRDREAIVLRLEQQIGYTELATHLGMPSPNAARVAVKRALYRLAHQMSLDAHRCPPEA